MRSWGCPVPGPSPGTHSRTTEEAAKAEGDVCYGCHGGRKWYRIAYPYPRNAWTGMAEEIPDWAKERPTESQPRFQTEQKQAAK
jgi:hypothetical protein